MWKVYDEKIHNIINIFDIKYEYGTKGTIVLRL